MKKIIPFLAIIFLLVACGDDDDANSNTDLTELAVGVYYINGSQEEGIITVNKKDNQTVTISVQYNSSEPPLQSSFSFTNVILNSETSFTLGEYSYGSSTTISSGPIPEECFFDVTYTGTGTASTSSISLFITNTSTPGEPNPCPESFYGTNNRTVSGVRQ